MSIFHASFQKARSGMLTNICEIEKVVELTDEVYERFSQNLTVSSELLSQESDRFRVDEHGIARCLLVMAEGRQDGTLVLTEGYDYARHTAHLPNARQFLKMEQSFRLAEFVDRMHSLTNQFVADAIDRQVEGEYKVSLAPIRNKVVNDSFSASLFMEMLSERPEIAEVDYDYENDTVSVALADEHIRFTDESGMRYLTEQDIEVMCAKHILWLNDEGGEQADFSNCVIRGMDLSRRNLNQAIFDGAKISNTQLYSAELCYASCVGAKFYNCYATDLTAEEANFKGAKFIGAELGRGIFTHSNFTDAPTMRKSGTPSRTAHRSRCRRCAMAGKIKSIHGIYKKHGREAFLEAAAYYSDHVNPNSIDKISMRWSPVGTMPLTDRPKRKRWSRTTTTVRPS